MQHDRVVLHGYRQRACLIATPKCRRHQDREAARQRIHALIQPHRENRRGGWPQADVDRAEAVPPPGPCPHPAGPAGVVDDCKRRTIGLAGLLGVDAKPERPVEARTELAQVVGNAGSVREHGTRAAPLDQRPDRLHVGLELAVVALHEHRAAETGEQHRGGGCRPSPRHEHDGAREQRDEQRDHARQIALRE